MKLARHALLAALLSTAIAVAGCGRKEESRPVASLPVAAASAAAAPASSTAGSSDRDAKAGSPVNAAAGASAGKEEDALKVAFAYLGKVGDGGLRIWRGPMISSEDKEVLSTGEVADDTFISEIMFYVKGVEGKVPTGN